MPDAQIDKGLTRLLRKKIITEASGTGAKRRGSRQISHCGIVLDRRKGKPLARPAVGRPLTPICARRHENR
jgi:hypothetical protein